MMLGVLMSLFSIKQRMYPFSFFVSHFPVPDVVNVY